MVLLWVTGMCRRTVSLMEADIGAIGRPPGGTVGMGMHRTAASIHRARGSMLIHSIRTRSMYIHALTGRAIPSIDITGSAITGAGIPSSTPMGAADTIWRQQRNTRQDTLG